MDGRGRGATERGARWANDRAPARASSAGAAWPGMTRSSRSVPGGHRTRRRRRQLQATAACAPAHSRQPTGAAPIPRIIPPMTDADAAAMPRGNSRSRRPGRTPAVRGGGLPSIPCSSRRTRCCSCGRRTSRRPSRGDVLLPLLVTMAAPPLLTIVLGLIFRDIRKAALILTPLIIGLLGYGHATRLLASLRRAGRSSSRRLGGRRRRGDRPRVPALRTQPGPAGDGADRGSRPSSSSITLVQIVPYQLTTTSSTSTDRRGRQGLATTTDAPKRDVYWFIFDRYGSDRALDLLYGIDNDLTPWLREQGFTVLDNAHPNYVKTSLSVATTNQMTHILDMPGVPGPDENSQAFLTSMIQDLGSRPASSRPSATATSTSGRGGRRRGAARWRTSTSTRPAPDEFTSSLIEASAVPAILRAAGAGHRQRRGRATGRTTSTGSRRSAG